MFAVFAVFAVTVMRVLLFVLHVRVCEGARVTSMLMRGTGEVWLW